MKFLDKLTKKTKAFQRTIGLTIEQFNLFQDFRKNYVKSDLMG